MKVLAAPLVILAFMVSTAVAAPVDKHPLAEVQRERYRAMIDQNLPALEEVLGRDLVYSHSDGTVENRAEFLRTIRRGVIRYFDLEDLSLKVRDRGDWAILNGTVKMDCVLGDRPRGIVHLNFTAVYENRDGRWQLTTWQTTMAKKQPPMKATD